MTSGSETPGTALIKTLSVHHLNLPSASEHQLSEREAGCPGREKGIAEHLASFYTIDLAFPHEMGERAETNKQKLQGNPSGV